MTYLFSMSAFVRVVVPMLVALAAVGVSTNEEVHRKARVVRKRIGTVIREKLREAARWSKFTAVLGVGTSRSAFA